MAAGGDPTFQQLVELFVERRVAVFVGAGFSAHLLPTWDKLMHAFESQLHAVPKGTPAPDIAQFYKDQYGLSSMKSVLEKQLGIQAAPDKLRIHQSLLSLPIRSIFTTNFDTLLEQALRLKGQEPKAILSNENVPSFRFDHPTEVQVVKVHGDLSHADSIVFTSRDYECFLTKHPAMRRLVEFVMQTHHVLFLGYSFTDPDLRTMWGQVFSEGGQLSLKSYIVLFDPPEVIRESLKYRNLQVIALRRGGRNRTEVLTQWLDALSTAVERRQSGRSEFSGPSGFEKAHIPPPTYVDFIERPEAKRWLIESIRQNVITIVTGLQGEGKTSLGIKVAREYEAREHDCKFPSIVWIAAEGGAREGDWLDSVLNHVARATGFPLIAQIPIEEQGRKQEEVEKILKERPALLIIDDYHAVRGSDLESWLRHLSGAAINGLRILVLSRPEMGIARLPGARRVLGGFSDQQALELIQLEARARGIESYLHREDPETLQELIRVVNGNPQAIQQSLGLIAAKSQNARQVIEKLRSGRGNDISSILRILCAGSWDSLSPKAQAVLTCAPVFPEAMPIRHDALQAVAGLQDSQQYDGAVEELVAVKLLEKVPAEKRYTLHPTTRNFVAEKLRAERGLDHQCQRRLAQFTLRFLEQVVRRKQPNVPYWNALVTESMDVIDPEWPMVKATLDWILEEAPEKVVPFTLLLVHYLDSRFRNNERLRCVSASIGILTEMLKDRPESSEHLALFRLDALAWTNIEDGKLKEARTEVDEGAALAASVAEPQRRDLIALAEAWRGRICSELADQVEPEAARALLVEADDCIARALGTAGISPWILARVYMAKGDIAFKRSLYPSALDSYNMAVAEEEGYGGEARNYQLAPRIGFARLELYIRALKGDRREAAEHLREARERFEPLAQQRGITIGKMYGDLGIALVELSLDGSPAARERVMHIRRDVERQSSSNVLKKILDKLVKDLGASQGGAEGSHPTSL